MDIEDYVFLLSFFSSLLVHVLSPLLTSPPLSPLSPSSLSPHPSPSPLIHSSPHLAAPLGSSNSMKESDLMKEREIGRGACAFFLRFFSFFLLLSLAPPPSFLLPSPPLLASLFPIPSSTPPSSLLRHRHLSPHMTVSASCTSPSGATLALPSNKSDKCIKNKSTPSWLRER